MYVVIRKVLTGVSVSELVRYPGKQLLLSNLNKHVPRLGSYKYTHCLAPSFEGGYSSLSVQLLSEYAFKSGKELPRPEQCVKLLLYY